MRIILGTSALFALLAAAPALAQGTAQQRASCEADAYRLCDAYVPDAIAVERCLRGNMGALSAPCRAEFGGAPAPAPKRRRR